MTSPAARDTSVRFLEAFSAAAHDFQLEQQGHEIYHFFDSDFLHRIIFGYRDGLNHQLLLESAAAEQLESVAGQQLFMGALVGQRIGNPPLMRALPPHLLEIRLAVSRPRPHDAPRSRDMTISLLDLNDVLRELRRDLKRGEAEGALRHFLDEGPTIFYGIELLSGSWESRLGRLLELQIHAGSPFDREPEIVAKKRFDVLARCVGQISDETRQGGAVSGLRDTMALSMLAAGVAETDEGRPPQHLARFYTETPRIHRAWNASEEFRSLLTYRYRDDDASLLHHSVAGVLRTSYYYLIRALMPELGYEPPSGQSKVYEIGRELASAADELRKGGLRPEELSTFPVGDSTLGHYMAEVTDLSSYSRAWRRLTRVPTGLPPGLGDLLTEVIQGERDLERALDESYRKHVEELSRHTQDVAAFTDTYVHLIDVVGQKSTALRPAYGRYSDHFGLVRWGFAAADDADAVLRDLVDSYEDWADEQGGIGGTRGASQARFVVELAHRLFAIRAAPFGDIGRVTEEIALLGFLWLMGDYDSVSGYGETLLQGMSMKLGRQLRRRGQFRFDGDDERLAWLGGATENMTVAAEVRVSVANLSRDFRPGQASHDALVTHAEDAVRRLDDDRRRFPVDHGARAVTQGYILFHVWRCLNPSVIARSSTRTARLRRPDVATRSLTICLWALERCEASAPSYPALLNHCLYVAAVTGLDEEWAELQAELVRELIVYRRSDGQSWSYRYDDTLGYYYYVRAARTVAHVRQAGDGRNGRIEGALKDLAEAKRWLDYVPESLSDDDVIAHRGLLRELEAEVERMYGAGWANVD